MIKVVNINAVEPNAFTTTGKDGKQVSMDKTFFTDDKGTTGYTFARIQVGEEYDGSWSTDKRGGNQFKKTPKPFVPNTPQSQEKQFKADPDSRESIEWQTSIKAAVEIVRDFHSVNKMPDDLESYTREIDTVAVHIKELINVKPKPVVREIDTADDDNLPPVELYQ